MARSLSLTLAALLLSLSANGRLDAQTWVHLSTVTGDLEVPNVGGTEQTDAMVFDVDGDGLLDFVIGERTSTPSALWYKRTPTGWVRHIIDNTALRIDAGGGFADVDGDGDLDVVFGADYTDTRIWWFENPAPNFDPAIPWNRYIIKSSGVPMHHDLELSDFDGDGQLEIAFWNQGPGGNLPLNYLFVADVPVNPHTSTEWPRTQIFQGAMPSEGLAVIDVNLDGVDDFVGGGHWFEYTPGGYVAHPVDTNLTFAAVAAGELVGGGRPELVFVPGDAIGPGYYYEWSPVTNSWTPHALLGGISIQRGHSLVVGDMNDDGHGDIFLAEMRLSGTNPTAKTRFLYGDGAGNFTEEIVATGIGMHQSFAADLDGDGDIDVLGKPFNWQSPRLDIFLRDGTGPVVLPLNRWRRHLIDAQTPWQPVLIEPGDVDGDGKLDLLAGGWWWRNPGNPAGSWTRQAFGPPLNNLVRAFDADGDGDLDVLGTAGMVPIPFSPLDQGDQFHWGRNDVGQFTIFPAGSSGSGGASFLQGVEAGVFTPGGELLTLLSWQDSENSGMPLQFVRPGAPGPTGPWVFGAMHPLSQGEGVSVGDIDGDGDLDIFQGTRWLRNDGNLQFTQFVVNNTLGGYGLPDRNRLADLDGDGDLDAVLGFAHFVGPSTSLIWLEQPADPTTIWTPHVVATGLGGGYSLDVADMDRDQNLDVILGEHLPPYRLLIFENRAAGQVWVPHTVDAGGPGIDHHLGSRAVDIDGDGDLDLISIGWTHDKVWLFENLGGDALLDTNPPAAPTGLVAQVLDDRRAALGWDDNLETDLAGYAVHRSLVPGFTPSLATRLAVTGPTSQYLDTSLAEGQTFHYQVVALDAAGNASPASTQVTVTTPADLTPPRILSARALGPLHVELVFSEPVDPVTAAFTGHYQLNGSGAPLAVLVAPDGWRVTLTVSALAPGIVHTVTVVGVLDQAAQPNAANDSASFISGADLVALYLLDEGTGNVATDHSGAGHDGTLAGHLWSNDLPLVPAAPPAGGSIAFNGVDGRCDLGVLDVAGDELTLAAWIRPSSFGVHDARIIAKATGINESDHIWMLSTILDAGNYRLRARLKVGAQTVTCLATADVLVPGQWTHAALVYDGSTLAIYQDGQLAGSVALTGPLAVDPTVGVSFGNQPPGAGPRPLHGLMDDVRIYARALTPLELTSLSSQAPRARDDQALVAIGAQVQIDVLANDDAPATSSLDSTSVEVLLSPAHGTALVDPASGIVTYTHDGSAAPFDAFTYRVADLAGHASNEALVSVSVDGPCAPVQVVMPPVPQQACAGADVVLEVGATGSPPLSYQWQRNGLPVAGAQASTLTLAAISAAQAGNYRCVVSNPCSSQVSASAAIAVDAATVIVTPPLGQVVCSGTPVTLNVVAAGTGPLSYQWLLGGAPLAGATGASLGLGPVGPPQAGSYQVVVGGPCGSVTSTPALLVVELGPVVVVHPLPQVKCAGLSATLSVTATGAAPLTYQWRRDGIELPGESFSTLMLGPLTVADQGHYDCVVTSGCGQTPSNQALLTVLPAPVITTPPVSTAVCAGSALTLQVVATGATTYTWRRNGVQITAPSPSPVLSIAAASPGDAGSYVAVASGPCGSATSAAAAVTVDMAPVITAQPQDQVVCSGQAAGFAVTASGTGISSYQWFLAGVPVPGATAASFVVPAVTPALAGEVHVVVTATCGSIASSPVQLGVDGGPQVLAHPQGQAACEGFPVQFTVVATTMTGALSYQWRRGGVNLPGANHDQLVLAPVTFADGGSYDVLVMGPCGTATSNAAALTVVAQPLCDCNGNGQLDTDEIAQGQAPDCNANGVPDACDVSAGTSADADGDGIPDECVAAFRRGDCSGNGSTNLVDAIQLLNYLFAMGVVPGCLSACDADDSGTLNLADAIQLLCMLFCGSGQQLPPPFPACGVDPTSDALYCVQGACP